MLCSWVNNPSVLGGGGSVISIGLIESIIKLHLLDQLNILLILPHSPSLLLLPTPPSCIPGLCQVSSLITLNPVAPQFIPYPQPVTGLNYRSEYIFPVVPTAFKIKSKLFHRPSLIFNNGTKKKNTNNPKLLREYSK